jgi:hypothetical protein
MAIFRSSTQRKARGVEAHDAPGSRHAPAPDPVAHLTPMGSYHYVDAPLQLRANPSQSFATQCGFDGSPARPVPASIHHNGNGLPPRLKSGIEQLSGIAMGDVKVRFNSPKPADLNALAYARGAEIHLGPGQEAHLPHEAWHVVQQRQGRVAPTMAARGIAINDDRALEHEADRMGALAMQTAGRPELRYTRPVFPAASASAPVMQRRVNGSLARGTKVWDRETDRNCYIVRLSESRDETYVVTFESDVELRHKDDDEHRSFDQLDPIKESDREEKKTAREREPGDSRKRKSSKKKKDRKKEKKAKSERKKKRRRKEERVESEKEPVSWASSSSSSSADTGRAVASSAPPPAFGFIGPLRPGQIGPRAGASTAVTILPTAPVRRASARPVYGPAYASTATASSSTSTSSTSSLAYIQGLCRRYNPTSLDHQVVEDILRGRLGVRKEQTHSHVWYTTTGGDHIYVDRDRIVQIELRGQASLTKSKGGVEIPRHIRGF